MVSGESFICGKGTSSTMFYLTTPGKKRVFHHVKPYHSWGGLMYIYKIHIWLQDIHMYRQYGICIYL